jgi:IMP and pyridine-specific 5'-nucleotidase
MNWVSSQYNTRTHLLHRRFVPPTFKEVRHIINIATVHGVAPVLKMVTFDADDTIYEDGGTANGRGIVLQHGVL